MVSSSAAAAFLRLQQKQRDVRIDLAAARRHRQSVDGAEAHRGIDASAVEHGAHAGAATEMRHNHPSCLGRVARQRARDVVVGNSVIPPVPNLLAEHRGGQGVSLCDLRHGPMERRVEHGDLRERGICFCHHADGRPARTAGVTARSARASRALESPFRRRALAARERAPPSTTRWPTATILRPASWRSSQVRTNLRASSRSEDSSLSHVCAYRQARPLRSSRRSSAASRSHRADRGRPDRANPHRRRV